MGCGRAVHLSKLAFPQGCGTTGSNPRETQPNATPHQTPALKGGSQGNDGLSSPGIPWTALQVCVPAWDPAALKIFVPLRSGDRL